MPTLADYIVEKIQKRPSKPSKKRREKGTTFFTGSSTGKFVAELTMSTTSDAPTAPHNIVVSHNSFSTHMHATTCDKFDFDAYFEDISCREDVGNGGECGDAFMIENQMCNAKACVSGGRPGGVEGTRIPGGGFRWKRR